VSPYFAVTGTHPLLPLDIIEASYLLPPPDSHLTTTELIARCATELQKRQDHVSALRNQVFEARNKAAKVFERDHAAVIRDFNFQKGALVLVRNTAIEKSLNRKMRARYTGPYVVLACNKGGAYILSELDGSVFDRPVAAFRVVPYFARKRIDIPDAILDVDLERIREMQRHSGQGDDEASQSVNDPIESERHRTSPNEEEELAKQDKEGGTITDDEAENEDC
jgi:hypothetical protein